MATFCDPHRRLRSAVFLGLMLAGIAVAVRARAGQLPDLGTNVLIFEPGMSNIQEQLDTVFARQEKAQFGNGRVALLFKPGNYSADVRVGFYTQVLGLGERPDDVTITGAVRSTAEWMRGNATCNFWRSMENLAVIPARGTNTWAVSQATAIRRVHLRGSLDLSEKGWSSGGFLADSKIDQQVNSGTQQQWFSRNAAFGSWTGGSWNMVFVGVINAPSNTWPDAPCSAVAETPVIREKPFLCLDKSGNAFVVLPDFQPNDSRGVSWNSTRPTDKRIPVSDFYIAHPETDSSLTLNAALASGKHLLLTPGIYPLDAPLSIRNPDTIVLGLGYPTLRPEKGGAAITVANVDGVTLAGLILEAGEIPSKILLEVGEPRRSASHATNPIVLSDLSCRVGGAIAGKAECQVQVHANDVIIDNAWLWRADHGRGAAWDINRNAHGLIVNGDHVTSYGLFVEHCQDYQVVWNGNGGRVFFYQSELPYDPPDQKSWQHGDVRGFASYKVSERVRTHFALGLGVYCVFWKAPVICDNAIEVPDAPGVRLDHMITIRLNGHANSGINHVINGLGDPVITRKKSVWIRYPSVAAEK
ncbi:MAG: coagulation factor 5/8 type domain-containing protein [Verrucomicrobiota bacterium]